MFGGEFLGAESVDQKKTLAIGSQVNKVKRLYGKGNGENYYT